MPIALSDDQLSTIIRHAEPLAASDRPAFLHRVASLLYGIEIGDGAVSRACAQAQSEFFKAPNLVGGQGTPKPLRRVQQRASSAT